MNVASRTPEGMPNLCPVCGSAVRIEPSDPADDAPCPQCGHLLWFSWEDASGTMGIKPTCAHLKAEDLDTLVNRLSEQPGLRLVVDLSRVRYVSSDALSKLIALKKKIVGASGEFHIENLHPDLLEVFRITRLDQVFRIGR
jgi:anti-anti-sigma factor